MRKFTSITIFMILAFNPALAEPELDSDILEDNQITVKDLEMLSSLYGDIADGISEVGEPPKKSSKCDAQVFSEYVAQKEQEEEQVALAAPVVKSAPIPEEPISPTAIGARKVLATVYQSCLPLETKLTNKTPNLQGVWKTGSKRVIGNKKAMVRSHIVLSQLDKDPNYPAPGCQDATKIPPVYGYGSKKTVNSQGEIDLFTRGLGVSSRSGRASGMDCSSFASVAMATMGLKFEKNQKDFLEASTQAFNYYVDRKTSCLQSIPWSKEESLLPGDIINISQNHIIIVDEVGPDPLGVQKHLKNKTCSRISQKDFDFTYLHSGATGNSYGPSRVHVSKGGSTTIMNNLVLSARKMCTQIARNPKAHGSMRKLYANKRFSVSRHESQNDECKMKPIKLKNQSCIEKCFEEEI